MAFRSRLQPRLAKLMLMPTVLSACGQGARLAMVDRATRLKHPDVPAVDPDAAKALIEQGAVWVDVRTPEERSVSRIPGAIDGEAVIADPDAYTDTILVAYCTVGVRSAAWAAARRQEGLDVRNLSGSVMAWAEAGGAFVTPSGTPTTEVHTWSTSFDWLPEGYEGVVVPAVPGT